MSDQNIPKQTFNEHLLEYSTVEKYFYKREHELTSIEFLETVRSYDPELPLNQIDESSLKKLLAPIITLRQVCTHPITVGRYLVTEKKVSSIKDTLDSLISKNAIDSEETLRSIVSSLNGLAGTYILLQKPELAIEQYKKVLQLSSRFEKSRKRYKPTVDKLQLIHSMHNLAKIIKIKSPDHFLKAATLRNDCAKLEEKYIENFMKQTSLAYESMASFVAAVPKYQEQNESGKIKWYHCGLDWVFLNGFEEFINEVKSNIDSFGVKQGSRFSNDRDVLKQLVYKWDEDISHLRNELFIAVNNLYELKEKGKYKIDVKESIVSQAADCHLRPTEKNEGEKCAVCKADDIFKRYEAKLYSKIKKKTYEEISLLGSWKPRLEELIIKSLLSVMKSKNSDENSIKEAETHIKLIELVKKEFKETRRFWLLLDKLIRASHELITCKLRVQLKNTEIFEATDEKNQKKLNYTLETQSYLGTLKKQYKGQSLDPCPICKNKLEQHWSTLNCGHSYCPECIQLILELSEGEHIQCSICRTRHKINDISYIKDSGNVTNDDVSQVKGNFSTKIEAVIKLIIELRNEDPTVKILIFSSWISVLKCLGNALEMNNINTELALDSHCDTQIKNFKDNSKKVTGLLLPINLGSKGLNLIEATHVVFVEPLLNPADELQAIGRVHRIGQTRSTVVHKFLIKNTIEESVHQATTSDAEMWDKNKVTLRQFINLFMGTNDDKNVINVEAGTSNEG